MSIYRRRGLVQAQGKGEAMTDKTCKTCKHWHKYSGKCVVSGGCSTDSAWSEYFSVNESGDEYIAGIITGPDFGCIKHESKAKQE